MQSVLPELKAAEKGLSSLKKSDLTEIRSVSTALIKDSLNKGHKALIQRTITDPIEWGLILIMSLYCTDPKALPLPWCPICISYQGLIMICYCIIQILWDSPCYGDESDECCVCVAEGAHRVECHQAPHGRPSGVPQTPHQPQLRQGVRQSKSVLSYMGTKVN